MNGQFGLNAMQLVEMECKVDKGFVLVISRNQYFAQDLRIKKRHAEFKDALRVSNCKRIEFIEKYVVNNDL